MCEPSITHSISEPLTCVRGSGDAWTAMWTLGTRIKYTNSGEAEGSACVQKHSATGPGWVASGERLLGGCHTEEDKRRKSE